MSVKVPNYLFPLQSDRQLQWTKQVVSGESSAKAPIRAKTFNAPKKEVLKVIVKKSKKLSFGNPQKTRNFVQVTKIPALPEDPMKAPDPTVGVGHLAPKDRTGYNAYQP